MDGLEMDIPVGGGDEGGAGGKRGLGQMPD